MPIGEPQWWIETQQRYLHVPNVPVVRFHDYDPEMESTPIYNRLRALRGNTRTFDRFDGRAPATRRIS